MGEGATKGKSVFSAKWVIRDKDNNIIDQGTDGPTQGGKGEEKK